MSNAVPCGTCKKLIDDRKASEREGIPYCATCLDVVDGILKFRKQKAQQRRRGGRGRRR